jgi:hypothetical protein
MKPMAAKLSTLPAAPDAPPLAPRRRPAASGNIGGLLLIIIAVMITGVLAFPSFIILACGLPPALAAALIDNRPRRHASYCVMAANLAGIAPVLAALWFGGNTVSLALMLMSDVYVWLGIYGTAASGWVLIWILAYVMDLSLALIANYGINKRRADQQALVGEWGAGVTGEVEAD